jgi:phage baseplate assembly protein W
LERFKRYLGTGWGFPVSADQDGGVGKSSHEENVEENIRIIIGTAPGERRMRPEFGCKIHDLMFRPNNWVTAGIAETFVRMAVAKWEPRVGNVEVTATPDPDNENVLKVEVAYTIMQTNTSRNLVYPFYLQGEEEEA